MADVQIYFLDPINIFLGKPQYGSGHAGMLRDFDDLSEEALRAAAEKVCEGIRGKSAPAIKELKKHLVGQRHKAEVYSAARVGPDPWDFEAIRRLEEATLKSACFMCRCNLGRRADKEGWLVAMIEFAMKRGRIPEGREIDACIAQARRTDHSVAMAVKEGLVGKEAERIAQLEYHSRMVFGDEAIKRTLPTPTVRGQQGRRAGTDYGEKQKAEEKLQALADDYEPLSASPLLKASLGLPTRGRAEKKFETEG